MKKQNITQKISVFFAYLFYLLGLGCVAAVIYHYMELGGAQNPTVAAFGAAVVFFVGGGIVLHVMGKADIPDFRVK